MKKQAEISRNPMIYNNPEFEKPVKMVDFCRSRVLQLCLAGGAFLYRQAF